LEHIASIKAKQETLKSRSLTLFALKMEVCSYKMLVFSIEYIWCYGSLHSHHCNLKSYTAFAESSKLQFTAKTCKHGSLFRGGKKVQKSIHDIFLYRTFSMQITKEVVIILHVASSVVSHLCTTYHKHITRKEHDFIHALKCFSENHTPRFNLLHTAG
jgi:hypothetical protein